MPSPAHRIDNVQPPATIVAGDRARTLALQGRDIIDLSQSSPYHVTPPHIVEAGMAALRAGLTNISSPRGELEFRRAMARKLESYNDLQVDFDNILVTPGSKQGLYYSMNGYIGEGDEVLLPEPTWVSFKQQVELSQGTPVSVPLSEEEEYCLTYDALQQRITPATKALVINNPNNPTGRVYSVQELQAAAKIATEHDLLVICDETYEYFVYGSGRHVTLASLPGMWDRTLTSYTFTKAYAMSGWRLGCIVGPQDLLEPLRKVHEHTASFVSPFVQAAGTAALDGPQDHIEEWRLDCESLRTVVAARLNEVAGLTCTVPQGATFAFPRYSANHSSAELAMSMIEKAGVVVTPGSGFGDCGEGHFRIALMRSPSDRVLEGTDRICRFFESLQG